VFRRRTTAISRGTRIKASRRVSRLAGAALANPCRLAPHAATLEHTLLDQFAVRSTGLIEDSSTPPVGGVAILRSELR